MSVIQAGVVRTLCLDRRLRERLRRAARATSRTGSDLIREAVERRCAGSLAGRAAEPLADRIGSVRGDGSGYGRRTGGTFGEMLVQEARRRRRR